MGSGPTISLPCHRTPPCYSTPLKTGIVVDNPEPHSRGRDGAQAPTARLRLVRAMPAATRCSPLATTVDLAGDGHEARANRRRTLHPWPPTSAIRGGSESSIRTLLTTAPNACGRLKRYLGASSKLRAQCASLITSAAGRHGASSTCRRQTCHAPSRTVSFQHEIQSAD